MEFSKKFEKFQRKVYGNVLRRGVCPGGGYFRRTKNCKKYPPKKAVSYNINVKSAQKRRLTEKDR